MSSAWSEKLIEIVLFLICAGVLFGGIIAWENSQKKEKLRDPKDL